MYRRRFTVISLVLRVVVAVVLVFLTYNPSGYSYFHWLETTTVARNYGEIGPWIALAGIALLIAWVVFLRATLRSLGAVGLILALGVCVIVLWLVIDIGILPTETAEPVVYSALVLVGGILGVGMSWSHIRRRLSGQVDVDDVDRE